MKSKKKMNKTKPKNNKVKKNDKKVSSRPEPLPLSSNGVPTIRWFPKWLINLFKK